MVQSVERYKVKLSHSSVCPLLHQLGLSAREAPAVAGYQQKPRGSETLVGDRISDYPTSRTA